MTRPLVKDVRKDIPLRVKLAVALRMLGFAKGQRVDFDHDSALGLRDWDEHAQDFIPSHPDIDAPPRERSRIPFRGFSREHRPLRSRSTFQKHEE